MLRVNDKTVPDLSFQVEKAGRVRFAAAPHLTFTLRIKDSRAEEGEAALIHSIALRCQIRIEPARRRYTAAEQGRLLDLFGTPERWGQTLRPMLWVEVNAMAPSFTGCGGVDLLVPCSYDFSLAATKYFSALDEGDMPLCFLFSGTIFYESPENRLQAAQVPWDKEAYFRLPAAAWRELMDLYYPNCAWLCLRKDAFDALNQYRSRQGLPTWEQAIERLLAAAEMGKP